LEKELFYGVNVTIKEKEEAINYLKNKLCLTENQILNFLFELNNVHSNLKSVSLNYENEIDRINRINTMNERDKDILISDLNNRIIYLTKTCEN